MILSTHNSLISISLQVLKLPTLHCCHLVHLVIFACS